MLGNRKYCDPLTITDYCSRYLLACESLVSTKSTFAFNVFERVKDYVSPAPSRQPGCSYRQCSIGIPATGDRNT
jgi:hypothetical protein